MKAIILAAGEGIRMRPLTLERPKALVTVNGKSLLGHTIESLPKTVDTLILVIGYLGEQIRDFCKDEFLGKKIRYVWQAEKLGTGHALQLCAPLLGEERFFLLYADDLHDQESLGACLPHDRALVVTPHSEPKKFGVVSLDKNGDVQAIIEKPEVPQSNLVSTGAMILDHHIFDYAPDRHANGEYYLTSMVNKLIAEKPVAAVRTDSWFPIATPQDLDQASEFLHKRAGQKNSAIL